MATKAVDTPAPHLLSAPRSCPPLSLELGLLPAGAGPPPPGLDPLPRALGSLLPSPVLGPRRAHTCCLFTWSLRGHPSGRPQPVCGVWGSG